MPQMTAGRVSMMTIKEVAIMSNEKKRTSMQSLHGKLCVSLYEELGDTVLPVIRKTYGEYGREIGSGLKRKTGVSGLQDAHRSFVLY